MIVILDDTFYFRHKYHNVDYLQNEPYKNICKIYEKPTKKDFREIVTNFSECQLFCNHRSLQLYNDEGEIIDSGKTIESLYTQVNNNNILRIEFGRDMLTNILANSIDKDLFYDNLKSLLDYFIQNKSIEKRILFYGVDYQKIERLTIINNLIERLLETPIEKYENSDEIKKGLEIIFPNQNSKTVIDNWQKKELSKKEIRILINNKI